MLSRIAIALGIDCGFRIQTTGTAYEAETETLVARFDEAPTTALKDLINVTIAGLKSDGVFAEGDCLYVRGLHTAVAACQNWIKNAHNSTLVNAPTFTAKQGFTGDGATSYINNNYTPSTDHDKYTLASASLGYMFITLPANNKALLGAANGVGGWKILWSINRTLYQDIAINNGAVYHQKTNSGSNEYATFIRNEGSIQCYINGIASGDPTVLETTNYPPNSIYELAYDAAETAGLYSTGKISFSFYGGYLTPTQVAALYNRIAYFYAHVNDTF